MTGAKKSCVGPTQSKNFCPKIRSRELALEKASLKIVHKEPKKYFKKRIFRLWSRSFIEGYSGYSCRDPICRKKFSTNMVPGHVLASLTVISLNILGLGTLFWIFCVITHIHDIFVCVWFIKIHTQLICWSFDIIVTFSAVLVNAMYS